MKILNHIFLITALVVCLAIGYALGQYDATITKDFCEQAVKIAHRMGAESVILEALS